MLRARSALRRRGLGSVTVSCAAWQCRNSCRSLSLNHSGETGSRRYAAEAGRGLAPFGSGGGKRFRPYLVFNSAALFGVEREAALPAAAAIECIHCYSLVHDDLPSMDNDELRRGQPTVWKAYDEWTAILAGDALQALAFRTHQWPQCHEDPKVRAELVEPSCGGFRRGGMVGGQVLDLEAGNLRRDPHRRLPMS